MKHDKPNNDNVLVFDLRENPVSPENSPLKKR
jgi:hypothetical protein